MLRSTTMKKQKVSKNMDEFSHRHPVVNRHVVPGVWLVCWVGSWFELYLGITCPPIFKSVHIPRHIKNDWFVPVLVRDGHVTTVVRECDTKVLDAVPTPSPIICYDVQIGFTVSLLLSVCEGRRTTDRKWTCQSYRFGLTFVNIQRGIVYLKNKTHYLYKFQAYNPTLNDKIQYRSIKSISQVN